MIAPMPSQSPPSLRRGSSCAALIVLSLIATVAAQDRDPASQPTTGPTSRANGGESRGPPLASLSEIRLDRRMTLLNAGEMLEPTAKLPEDAAAYVVELPSHKELILDLARRVGRPEPTVRVLPEESRTSDRYGIVTVDHAILRKGVRDVPGDRENLSDVTLGEAVWILDRDEAKTSLLVHATDGYLGWVDAKAVRAIPAPVMTKSLNGSIPAASNTKIDQAFSHARSFVGTRYVWGGKTKGGIDCSGLAQGAFASVGIPLPRDADQQSLIGRLVATRWDTSALLPGDLLFYVGPRRGNVHHVAIYLGDGEYIEAAGPDVHVSSMTPGAKNYDGKRAATFGWARRVLE